MLISTQHQAIGLPSNRSSKNLADYSPEGESLARQTTDVYDRSRGDWDQASRVATKGLRQIRDDDFTTSTEKDLANFGARLSGYVQADKSTIARMQRSVLGSIAAAVPGPTGQVLAQAGLQVIGYGSSDFKTGRTAANEALRMIVSSPQTDSREKDLAVLGMELGNDKMLNSEAMAMRRTVLNSLARGVGSAPMPQVLAKATAEATVLNEFSTWGAMNSATLRGLQEIHNHPDSTNRDRTVAQMGMQLGEGLHPENSVQVRHAFLNQLVQGGDDNASAAIAKAAVSVAGYYSERAPLSKKILDAVFAEVIRNPESTSVQKNYARRGLSNSGDPLYADINRLLAMKGITRSR